MSRPSVTASLSTERTVIFDLFPTLASLVLGGALLLVGCENPPDNSGAPRGLAPVQAIPLQVTSVEDGYTQEKTWARQHRPELACRDIRMEIVEGHAYDVLAATNSAGGVVDLYFETSLSSGQPALAPTVPIPASQTSPVYPVDLKFEGITGYAIVRFIVERDGSVSGASVLRETLPQFGKAAAETVRKWTYTPATKFGTAVRMPLQVTLYFTLAPKK